MTAYSGRLELTWTNKHLRLLAHDDGNSYEWVDPSDHRVSEVRLLRDAAQVGQVHPDSERARDNLLIRGDALNALISLVELPEFASEYRGKVRLVYIDPPFNTGQAFANYDDNLEHSVWLTMLRDRLLQVRELLAPGGTVWVHLDDTEQHRARSVLDEVFGYDAFVATFIWQKVDSPNDNKVSVTPDHDFIHCYAKPGAPPRLTPMPDTSLLDAYGNVDPTGRRYRDRLLKKNGKNSLRSDRPTMWFPILDPDGNEVYPIHDDGREARWSLGKEAVDELVASGQLIWKRRPTPDGSGERWVPYTREWAPENPTRPWPTIWTNLHTTRQAKAHLRKLFPGITPFETPKPERLMRRILEIASDPGDIVLDCFVGSGTTAAVAHKMGRRWVAVEWSEDTLATFTVPRLSKVVAGEDPGGVTEEVGWEGGGGFRILDVAPSMFVEEDGVIYLADWASLDELAEPVAAQFGFPYEPDPPFAGRKGRTRLAVIDGLINEDVINLLLANLADGERLLIAGTAVGADVDSYLQSRVPGSRVRKVPESILADYRNTYRRRRRVELHLDTDELETEPEKAKADA